MFIALDMCTWTFRVFTMFRILISAAALLTSEGEDHMLCFLLVYIVFLTCVHAVTIAESSF